MRSLSDAGALPVKRSGGSQIRSTWQSAEITLYCIALFSILAIALSVARPIRHCEERVAATRQSRCIEPQAEQLLRFARNDRVAQPFNSIAVSFSGSLSIG